MKSKGGFVVAWCVLASAMLLGQGCQGETPASAPPESAPPAASQTAPKRGVVPYTGPPPLQETVATDIPGVIKGGTKVVLIRAGFDETEGPISMPDGSLLFTEQEANKLIKIDKDDNISTFLEDTNRTIGLAYDHKGRLIGTQSRDPKVGVLWPTRQVLADSFEGEMLVRPNDLVIDQKGGIYFTDPGGYNPVTAFREPPPGRKDKTMVFYITPEGKITKLADNLSANGIQLSPDEKTLYVTNGENIMAFDVQPDGSVKNERVFVKSAGDGICVDNAGRLYSAVSAVLGVRVFSPKGEDLGTIPVGIPPQAVAFAGPEKKTLYVVGRGAVYKAPMIAEGIRSRAK